MGNCFSFGKNDRDDYIGEGNDEDKAPLFRIADKEDLDPQAFQANMTKAMLPANTTVLSKNQNYDLTTLNTGVTQAVQMNSVIIVLSFEESDIISSSKDMKDNDDEEDQQIYGNFDEGLVSSSVTTVVETIDKREQQIEQKEVFKEVDIDFVSRVDMYTHFGECIYSVASNSYKQVEETLRAQRSKMKTKKEEEPAPPPPPVVLVPDVPENNIATTTNTATNAPKSPAADTTNTPAATTTSNPTSIAAAFSSLPSLPEAIKDLGSALANVQKSSQQSDDKAEDTKEQQITSAIDISANNDQLLQHGGIRYDNRKRAVSSATTTTTNNVETSKYEDMSMVFSKSGRYELVEIDFPQMLGANVSYILFQIRFPFSAQQLKTTVQYKKTKKRNSNNAPMQRKIVEKKIPRATKLLVRIYERLTKVELCRYTTNMDPSFFVNSENADTLTGMLYFHHEEQKWFFRASNSFQPVSPTKFSITVIEASELPAMNSDGKADPYCTVEYAGKRLLKTSVAKKTLEPQWNQTGVLKFNDKVKYRINPADKLFIKCFDWDRFGKHDVIGELQLNFLDLFSTANATFRKVQREGTNEFMPVLVHDNEWFSFPLDCGKIKLNISLSWE